MLGREVNAPLQMSLPVQEQGEYQPEEYLTELKETFEASQKLATEVLKSKLKKMKKDYDLHCNEKQFLAGDAVYLLMKGNQKHKKLLKQWMGPAVILAKLSPAVYRVRINNRQTKVVNHDHLKPCTDRNIPKWIQETQKSIKEGLLMVNCPCGQPDETHGMMLQCDKCLIWYHTVCVNLTKQEVAKMKTFVCHLCVN